VRREAYDEALKQNESYVKDLRLAFLRAEKFDVHKAVIRMFAHYDMKWTLFQDPEILGRDIRFSDFSSPEDMNLLKQGMCQLLPLKDRVGRPIIFLYSPRPGGTPYDFKSKLKVFFWMGLLATRMGEDIQRKGLVVVWHGINAENKGSPEHGVKYFAVFASVSTACASIHALYDSHETTRSMSTIIAKADKSDQVFRFRTHYGSNIACLHSLMAYGIPRGSLPVDFDGTLRLEDYNRFLEEQARRENGASPSMPSPGQAGIQSSSPSPPTKSESSTYTKPPTEMDIICGRGQRGAKNPGNLLMKRLLEEKLSKYNKASRHGKALVSQEIYDAMRQAGCRFLAPAEGESRTATDRHYVPDLWKEVDEDAARGRIAHRFRNMRKPAP